MRQANIFDFEGKVPSIHPDAWVAPTATVIGDVTIEAGASIWYGAVLRGDVSPLVICARANIQDNTVIHAGIDTQLVVAADVTIGHNCVLHCAEIGHGSLVGNGAVVLDGARVGARSVVAAGAVVSPGTVVPSGMIVAGSPAKVIKEVDGSSAEMWLDYNAAFYGELAARHAVGARRLTT